MLSVFREKAKVLVQQLVKRGDTDFSSMSYRKRGSSFNYVVIRKQGINPVHIVRHSLSKKKAENEAKFLNSQFRDRNDVKFGVREEGFNRKRVYS